MQCPAQAAFDGPERSQAEGPQRASVGLSWARGKGSRAQALFGHEPSRAWAWLVQSLVYSAFSFRFDQGPSQWISNIGHDDSGSGAPPLLLPPVGGLDGVGGPSAKVDARGEKLQDGQGGQVPPGDAKEMLHLHHVRYIRTRNPQQPINNCCHHEVNTTG